MGNDNWITTFTGKQFNFGTLSDICVEDIAHALSLQCRFVGHCRRFYSVAEHSVRVSESVGMDMLCPELALLGLLHDAHEAYTGDVSRPLKRVVDIEMLQSDIQEAIERTLAPKLQFSSFEREVVKGCDDLVTMQEAEALLTSIAGWDIPRGLPPLVSEGVYGWSSPQAEGKFLRVYKNIMEELK